MSSSFVNDSEFEKCPSKAKPRRYFTLSGILTILAILVILIAFMLPATRSAGQAARRAQCTNNLKQIALALHNYERQYGTLPPAYTVDANGRPLHSWRTLILPYLDLEPLYRMIDLSRPWDDPANTGARESSVTAFHCPALEGNSAATTYLAIAAPGGCFLPDRPRPLAEITDSRESTLMVIEAGEENAVPWMAPVDADESLVLGIGPTTKLSHPGGVNACFVDGTVRFLKSGTSETVRRAAITISGKDDRRSYEP